MQDQQAALLAHAEQRMAKISKHASKLPGLANILQRYV